MTDFVFPFSLPKLVHSIAYFSTIGVQDLTKLKIAKLVYFADKAHLLEFGSPIIGDVYFCMDFGPVPSFALNEMNEAICCSDSGADGALMHEVLKVRKPLWSKHPHFEARNSFSSSVFEGSELQVLKKTAERYGKYSAATLIDMTHEEPTWKIPNCDREKGSRAPIPYELFFEGCDELARKHLAQLMNRFRGEIISLPGDAGYHEFARELIEQNLTDDLENDWSVDEDRLPKRMLQHIG